LKQPKKWKKAAQSKYLRELEKNAGLPVKRRPAFFFEIFLNLISFVRAENERAVNARKPHF
jgi:hypothetical protein